MDFNCDVKIVDAVMGAGKTSAAINYMSTSDESEKFMYITPLKSEVRRIIEKCDNDKRAFYQPEEYHMGDTKLNSIKRLVSRNADIASTHALFHRFDREMIDLCRAANYTLIMDEVTDVIKEYDLSKEDFKILLDTCVYIEEDTHLIKWREDAMDYNGKFANEKRLCDMNCLAYYGNSVMMWLFPIEVFNAFRKVYILTYKFNAQIQRYYYDYFGVPYEFIYVKGDSPDTYEFTEVPTGYSSKYDYKNLIHICDHQKLNMIGDLQSDLSLTWFVRNKNNQVIKKLKNNLVNYFNNICKAKSNDIIWTTFKDYKNFLKGKGYTSGFLSINARSMNEFRDRHYVAYAANRFLNPFIKSFFVQHDIAVDEDGYALSEMLQFIWRSAIRDGEEIYIYIPSIRMRTLLQNWIEENSVVNMMSKEVNVSGNNQ